MHAGIVALELSALDAVIGGIATAFFGGLLAGGAYILKMQLALREQVLTLAGRVETLRQVEPAFELLGLERLGGDEEEQKPKSEKKQGGAR